VLRPRGRRGEVVAELLTDFPERLAERRSLSALAPSGSRRDLELEEHWLHQGRLILKFRGVESIADAEALRDFELQIRREERVPLPAGSAYVSDLVGCTVVDAAGGRAREIGVIADVRFGSGDAPLLQVRDGSLEHLVPFAQAYLKRLDLEARIVEMVLPEGLLDLGHEESGRPGAGRKRR
jgi:16S rRNA processing protein RimM